MDVSDRGTFSRWVYTKGYGFREQKYRRRKGKRSFKYLRGSSSKYLEQTHYVKEVPYSIEGKGERVWTSGRTIHL